MRPYTLGSARFEVLKIVKSRYFPIYGDEQHRQDCLRDECRGLVVLDERVHDSPYHSLESEAFLAPENNISELAANDSFNQ
jgi:hypothetical protein